MSDIAKQELLMRLLEDEEEDDDIILLLLSAKRNKIDSFYTSRHAEGCFEILIKRHLNIKDAKFRKYCRLNKTQFRFVLSLIQNEIQPKKQGSITAEEKLFLTLRFLATGETYASLEFMYRISASYISRIIQQVLRSLRNNLVPIFLPVPTENQLKGAAKQFWNRWNCPNCFGAIDGKHVRIRAPTHSGSMFFNYKDYFSTVLLAIVDANYKFVAVDVGSYGKEGDNGIFQKSAMGKKIISGQFNVPQPASLPGTDILIPHFLIGDDAFALDVNMMKPYFKDHVRSDRAKAIFNYRICRARRVSENAFALLSQVFRILYTPIAIKPEICDDLIIVLCCLHNLLRDAYLENNGVPFYHYDETKPKPIQNMISLARRGGFSNIAGFQIRDTLKDFFNSEVGKVAWQEEWISRRN
ncbi:uncharacterized protein LOC126747037 [Anthonomus grandis grandis]|uniref:uncharacterized protein LOC126747037 n=1 Tax=Anthonomus grandis grandis TaxID=2921223 RepID=UPI002164F261|nr:uncharacterized protein LOC126747037 [Anthonomus grandis grandis]